MNKKYISEYAAGNIKSYLNIINSVKNAYLSCSEPPQQQPLGIHGS